MATQKITEAGIPKECLTFVDHKHKISENQTKIEEVMALPFLVEEAPNLAHWQYAAAGFHILKVVSSYKWIMKTMLSLSGLTFLTFIFGCFIKFSKALRPVFNLQHFHSRPMAC